MSHYVREIVTNTPLESMDYLLYIEMASQEGRLLWGWNDVHLVN